MSAKEVEDKKRAVLINGAVLTDWPWTGRQARRKLGNRKSRKQARRRTRNI